MPLTFQPVYLRMAPALRHGDEMFTARVQLVWLPHQGTATVSLEVREGYEQDDLRSLVVSPDVADMDVRTHLRLATAEAFDLRRRSRNPFDDLV